MSADFPYLEINDFYSFPDPLGLPEEDEIIAIGGNLSPGMLFSAYYQGVFPWYDKEPIVWWSLNPRLVMFPENIKLTKSMKKLFKKSAFTVTVDKNFIDVVKGCQTIKRAHEDGTWISKDILDAYYALHCEGYAHSVEVWDEESNLVGGLYGVAIGKYFAGESMFTRVSNSSKYGFITLVKYLETKGFEFIDCQQETSHLVSLGAKCIDRKIFYSILEKAINKTGYVGNWSTLFEDFSSFNPVKDML